MIVSLHAGRHDILCCISVPTTRATPGFNSYLSSNPPGYNAVTTRTVRPCLPTMVRSRLCRERKGWDLGYQFSCYLEFQEIDQESWRQIWDFDRPPKCGLVLHPYGTATWARTQAHVQFFSYRARSPQILNLRSRPSISRVSIHYASNQF
jgi:hypothetical protein